MIIRLSGADFSANNIGKIAIVRELTDETKELLTHYGKSFTNAQKFAIQDFIEGLKSEGIWPAIGNLYLPILSGSLAECGYNVKTGVTDLVLGESDYQLAANGLKLAPTTENFWDTASNITYNGSQQNLHLGAYNTDSYEGMTQTDVIYGMNLNDENRSIIQFGITSEGNGSLKTDGNSNVSCGAYDKTNWTNPTLKMVVQSTLGNLVMMNGSAGEYGVPIATDNTYSDVSVKLFNIASVWRENYSHYGLLTLGTSMTQDQANVYSRLADDFMGKFI